MPWFCPPPPFRAGVRYADPHSGDGGLSGSHLASPISMHYLGPPPFRVHPTLRQPRRRTQEVFLTTAERVFKDPRAAATARNSPRSVLCPYRGAERGESPLGGPRMSR